MSEFKPKKDDERADEGVLSKRKTGNSPKAQGDKLHRADDEASKQVQKSNWLPSKEPDLASRDHDFGRDGFAAGDPLAGSPWQRFPPSICHPNDKPSKGPATAVGPRDDPPRRAVHYVPNSCSNSTRSSFGTARNLSRDWALSAAGG